MTLACGSAHTLADDDVPPSEVRRASEATAGEPRGAKLSVRLEHMISESELQSLERELTPNDTQKKPENQFVISMMRLSEAEIESPEISLGDLQIIKPFTYRSESRKSIVPRSSERELPERGEAIIRMARAKTPQEIKAATNPESQYWVESKTEFSNLLPKAKYLVRYYYRGWPMDYAVVEADTSVAFPASVIGSIPEYKPKASDEWQLILLDAIASRFQSEAALDLIRRFPPGGKELDKQVSPVAYFMVALNTYPQRDAVMEVLPGGLSGVYPSLPVSRQPPFRTKAQSVLNPKARAVAAVFLAGNNRFAKQELLVTPLVDGFDVFSSDDDPWNREIWAASLRLPEEHRHDAERQLKRKPHIDKSTLKMNIKIPSIYLRKN